MTGTPLARIASLAYQRFYRDGYPGPMALATWQQVVQAVAAAITDEYAHGCAHEQSAQQFGRIMHAMTGSGEREAQPPP